MAWTTPRTWVAGELVTAAMLNTHLRDDLNAVVQALIGHTALRAIEQSSAPSGVSAESLIYSLTSDHQLYAKLNNGSAVKLLTAATAGVIVQVQSASTSTQATSTSTSFADSNLSVSITTQRSSNLVAVIGVQAAMTLGTSDNLEIQTVRNSTAITNPIIAWPGGATTINVIQYFPIIDIDTPGSAAAHTYKTQYRRASGAGSGVRVQPGSAVSRLVAIEIAA